MQIILDDAERIKYDDVYQKNMMISVFLIYYPKIKDISVISSFIQLNSCEEIEARNHSLLNYDHYSLLFFSSKKETPNFISLKFI